MTAVALKRVEMDVFGKDFAAHAGELPGAGLSWLDARRAKALGAFAKTGIPNRRVEAWKYTDLANAFDFDAVPARRVSRKAESVADAMAIVLANGFLQSAPDFDGVEIVDLGKIGADAPDWLRQHLGASAAGADQPLGAASLALMRGGVAVRVTGEMAGPLLLNFVSAERNSESVVHARVLIVLEQGASLRLIETHASEGGRILNNIGMEFVLAPGATLDHVRLQTEGPSALHVTSLGIGAARDSEYRALYVALGAELSRIDTKIALAEPGAHADIRSIAVLSAGVADTTAVIEHAAEHTVSRQLFKSVVGGKGRAVNQGRVKVAKGAVKSDSHQLFKALLLSPRAEADAKPELEIFADDVVCGHGTAIGALDEDALFYLRARGIPEAEARGLLVRAFLAEAVDDFVSGTNAETLWHALDEALARMERS